MEINKKPAEIMPAPTGGESMNSVLLEGVLKANEEEHLLEKIMELCVHVEDDPPVIFGWQNVEFFVQTIQIAQAQAGAPGGLPLPADPLHLQAALNVQNFKQAVLEYCRAPGVPNRLDTTCLPCSPMDPAHYRCRAAKFATDRMRLCATTSFKYSMQSYTAIIK